MQLSDVSNNCIYVFNILGHHIIFKFNTKRPISNSCFVKCCKKVWKFEWSVIILKPFTLKCMCTLQTWTLARSMLSKLLSDVWAEKFINIGVYFSSSFSLTILGNGITSRRLGGEEVRACNYIGSSSFFRLALRILADRISMEIRAFFEDEKIE